MIAIHGKSINLYLMDGESSSRIKCTLANWTGTAYKIPVTSLEKCMDRDDLKQSGVYFYYWTRRVIGSKFHRHAYCQFCRGNDLATLLS